MLTQLGNIAQAAQFARWLPHTRMPAVGTFATLFYPYILELSEINKFLDDELKGDEPTIRACGRADETWQKCRPRASGRNFENVCFCKTDNCNDIDQCKCEGANATTYASTKENEEAKNKGSAAEEPNSEAESSAHGIISNVFLAVLTAFGAWGLM